MFGVEVGMLVKCKLCAIHGGVLTPTCNQIFVAERGAQNEHALEILSTSENPNEAKLKVLKLESEF